MTQGKYGRSRARWVSGLIGVALPAFLLATWTAVPSGAADDEAKKAVHKVLDDQVAAWNKGDLEGFMAGYWQSPELSFFSGKDKTRGWRPTLERYRKRYQGEGKEMGHLTFRELEIEMLGAENAWVRGRWEVKMKGETPGGLFTLILKKLPEGWRVVHDHTSG